MIRYLSLISAGPHGLGAAVLEGGGAARLVGARVAAAEQVVGRLGGADCFCFTGW